MSTILNLNYFAACNIVLGSTRGLDELIQLQLRESFCLPLLQYGVCAVKLNSSQCADFKQLLK